MYHIPKGATPMDLVFGVPSFSMVFVKCSLYRTTRPEVTITTSEWQLVIMTTPETTAACGDGPS